MLKHNSLRKKRQLTSAAAVLSVFFFHQATQEAAPVLEEAEVHLGTAEDAERGVHATRIRREETERKANAEVAGRSCSSFLCFLPTID